MPNSLTANTKSCRPVVDFTGCPVSTSAGGRALVSSEPDETLCFTAIQTPLSIHENKSRRAGRRCGDGSSKPAAAAQIHKEWGGARIGRVAKIEAAGAAGAGSRVNRDDSLLEHSRAAGGRSADCGVRSRLSAALLRVPSATAGETGWLEAESCGQVSVERRPTGPASQTTAAAAAKVRHTATTKAKTARLRRLDSETRIKTPSL